MAHRDQRREKIWVNGVLYSMARLTTTQRKCFDALEQAHADVAHDLNEKTKALQASEIREREVKATDSELSRQRDSYMAEAQQARDELFTFREDFRSVLERLAEAEREEVRAREKAQGMRGVIREMLDGDGIRADRQQYRPQPSERTTF